MQDFQDFRPVVLHAKNNNKNLKTQDKTSLENMARIHDVNGHLKTMSKLDNETEDFHIDRVSSTLKQHILKARNEKKMTQAQLAQAINEKPQVIQEYESGKAVPKPQVLNKLSRVLGVKLNTKM